MVGLRGPDRPVYMAGDPRTPLSLVLGAKQATRGASTDSNVPVETRLERKGNDRDGTRVGSCVRRGYPKRVHRFLELRNFLRHCRLVADRPSPSPSPVDPSRSFRDERAWSFRANRSWFVSFRSLQGMVREKILFAGSSI